MPDRRWFMFDLGNVLIRLEYETVLEKIAKRSNAGRDQLIELMDAGGGYRDLERGLVTFQEFHAFLRDRIGYLDDLRAFRALWGEFFTGTIEGMDEVVRRARERYRIAFLSNSNEVHAEVIPKRFAPLFARNDIFIFSHRVRCAKPDPEIFHHALEMLGVRPAEVLYVDDLAENVAAARNVGIEAYHFQDAVTLVADLEAAGRL